MRRKAQGLASRSYELGGFWEFAFRSTAMCFVIHLSLRTGFFEFNSFPISIYVFLPLLSAIEEEMFP